MSPSVALEGKWLQERMMSLPKLQGLAGGEHLNESTMHNVRVRNQQRSDPGTETANGMGALRCSMASLCSRSVYQSSDWIVTVRTAPQMKKLARES